MDPGPLQELITGRGFERFQDGLRSRFQAYGFKYSLTYSDASNDPTLRLDFESSLHLGRVTARESGVCELEAIQIASGETVFREHYELDRSLMFHMVYVRLPLFMLSFTGWPVPVNLSPKPPQFRAATDSDASSVADVYLMSRKSFLPFAPLAHTDADVRVWIRDVLIPSGGVTIAEEAGSILGFMAMSRDDAVVWIDHLYLSPGATGLGIGSWFMKRAVWENVVPIRLYTFQKNHGARRFYERHGFVAVAFGDGSDNEEGCPDILYEWCGRHVDAMESKPMTEGTT